MALIKTRMTVEEVFPLHPTDKGRPLGNVVDDQISDMCAEALQNPRMTPKSIEIELDEEILFPYMEKIKREQN